LDYFSVEKKTVVEENGQNESKKAKCASGAFLALHLVDTHQSLECFAKVEHLTKNRTTARA
jgi:hypothetical protein